MSRKMSRNQRLRPLAGLIAAGIAAPAFAGSVPFPTYTVGPQANGSFVVSNGQVITPAGTQVNLGIRVRAKAVAVNPNKGSHTAAVLTIGAQQPVEIFDTLTGEVLQNFIPGNNTKTADKDGSYAGLTYSADGKTLIFSQNGNSTVTTAQVFPNGLLFGGTQISVPPDPSFIKCFPNSPLGDYGRTCGTFYTTSTAYPGSIAFSGDGKSAYALLNQNNTLAQIDLGTKKEGTQIRVGNAPHSIVVKGTTAYISNEGGRVATQADFQIYSAGTPIVADKVNGAAVTGTVSVVDLTKFQLTGTISTGGLHPTGMALYGTSLLVSNTYSDTISVIDTGTNKVTRTIDLALPIKAPGQTAAYGAAPVGIAVDAAKNVAFVTLYNANAIAVVDLTVGAATPVLGLIPVAYAPGSIALDAADGSLIVANDKGVGTLYSYETDHGVQGYNTHQDNGTVSIVPVPATLTTAALATMTTQVYQNNHWDLKQNIASAGGGSASTAPVALPAKIGDPSLIKHVFLIIRENRTYDQVLGDVAKGHGDAALAVFGGKDTPNMHTLLKRFPLFDNFYDPSRQSADGHQWITEAMAPYQDDIQAPDWTRSYPGGNAGDSLAYTTKGFFTQEALAAKLSVKIYGEYVENQTKSKAITSQADGGWALLYQDALNFEAGKEKTLKYQNQIKVVSTVPVWQDHLDKNFPQFDLNIPDQWRVDEWVQKFDADVKASTVPNLTILWIMDDHTGGPPSSDAEQADNDLAVGRVIDIVSHSNVWNSSAIFIEEDDAQNGVDHIDGHRSPGYIVSPYVEQTGKADHTFYTQVNMTRTMEQILGLAPLNQFDLVASPMSTSFVKGTPPKANFAPWDHVAAQVPLNQGDTTPAVKPANEMAAAWQKARTQMFAGKTNKPDSQDPDTLGHLNWYEATGYTRPYPGETTVRPPSDFKEFLGGRKGDDGDGDDD